MSSSSRGNEKVRRDRHALALGVVASALLCLAGCSHESADWKAASTADTPEAYQQFVQQHPNAANAAQARTRIAQLQEDRDWQAASSADTRDAYTQFVAQHPQSKWAQEARIRVENFAQGGAGGGAGGASAAASTTAAPTSKAPQTRLKTRPQIPNQVSKVSNKREAVKAQRVASAKPGAAGAAGAKHAGTGAGAPFVQLGAFRSQARAESQWKQLTARFPQELNALQPRYVAARIHARSLVRLQVGVATPAAAKGLCTKLRRHAQACVAVSA
jgi:hypothetical protein